MLFEDIYISFIFNAFGHLFSLVMVQFIEEATVQHKLYKRNIFLAIIGCFVWLITMLLTQTFIEAPSATAKGSILAVYSVYGLLHFFYITCVLEVILCSVILIYKFFRRDLSEKEDEECLTTKDNKSVRKTNRNILLSWMVALTLGFINETVINHNHWPSWSKLFILITAVHTAKK